MGLCYCRFAWFVLALMAHYQSIFLIREPPSLIGLQVFGQYDCDNLDGRWAIPLSLQTTRNVRGIPDRFWTQMLAQSFRFFETI